jgi:hypothetical protein
MISRVQLPLRPAYIGAFASLSFLCLAAHELVHHLVARWACGAWGSMTFWTFLLAPGCETSQHWLWATLAGPLLTHALIWLGLLLVLRRRTLLGVSIILANLPLGRFVTVLMRGGDEMVLGRTLWGEQSWPWLLGLTVLLLLPPLAVAYRSLAAQWRSPVFAAFLIVPLFWDMLFKRIILSPLLESVPAAVAGIPLLVVAANAFMIPLFLVLWSRSVRSASSTAISVA